MIHSRQPQRAITRHAPVSRHYVHHCVLEGVPHMQRARYVGRRNYNRKDRGIRILVDFRREVTTFFPACIVMALSFFRIVGFRDIDH